MGIETKSMLSDRVSRLKEKIRSATSQVDIERIPFLLEAYKETEGLPSVMKRAKVFEKVMLGKTLLIDDNPIVGTLTRYQPGGYPFPEYACRWMKKQVDFSSHAGKMTLAKEDREWIDKACEYWNDRNIYNRTREIMIQNRGIEINSILKAGVWSGTPVDATMIPGPVDYSKVLNKGLNGVIAEVEEAKAKLDIGNFESFDKWHTNNAQLICLNSVIQLAQRYASLAREMAQKETNTERKAELEKIAATCEWVPANPTRNFTEAIQSYWFILLSQWIEIGILGIPPGRLPQYLYPFYRKDKEEGRITAEDAIELLELLFLKIWGLGQFQSAFFFRASSARLIEKISIGGLTQEGRDATNELDWLILEAQLRIRLPEPELQLLYHDKLPEEFLFKAVDMIRETGLGQPVFFNTDIIVARNLRLWGEKGITIEEARDTSLIGCVQSALEHRSDFMWEGAHNMAKMVELALNNGKDPLSGIQVGPETGEAESFQSYRQLHEAVEKQLLYSLTLNRETIRVSWNVARDLPIPFSSALVDDCIEKGKDLLEGGARYSVASGTIVVGTIDLANSMTAIKKLVFEEERISIKQLKEALAADFEGYEDIQRMCIEAPKYGNDDDYADEIARQWYEIYWEVHQKTPVDFLDRPILPEAFSATVHADRGQLTGALPSGRKARTALTDASVSAYPGTDKNGPTALVKSAAKVIDTIKFGSNHFNMKFHPSALEGREGARKLLALIKTYMDLGGYHVQFNCVSSDVLKDAQLHPEEHRDLLVRVAGFSAYFVYLDEATQNELIERTALTFE